MPAILQKLELVGFRSHIHSLLDFEKFTMLIGPNGGGKTSILAAITYGLLGANHYTATDGKGAPAMATTGRSDFEIEMRFDPAARLTSLQRKRTPKVHELLVQGPTGHAGPGAIDGQRFILESLGIPHETLLALLDPRPLLGRDEKLQKDILVRVLRGATIEVTEALRAAGIKQLLDIEHLDKVHAILKTGTLRDLNRDKKAAQAKIDEGVPEWPYPGWTEEKLAAKLATARKEHEAALETVGSLRAKLEAPKVAPNMTAADAVEKRALVDSLQEQAAKLEEQIIEHAANRSQLNKEFDQRGRDLSVAREKLAVLERSKPKRHDCPTCTCDLSALQETADQAIQRAREDLESIRQILVETGQARDIATEAERRAQQEQAGIDRNLKAMKTDLGTYDKATATPVIDSAAIQQQLTEAEAAAESLRASVERGDKCMAAIAVWKRDQATAQEHAKKHRDLMDQIPQVEAAIRDLERIREKILSEGIGPFLETMKGFLAPFGMANVAYNGEQFLVDGRPATYLSRGQSAMFFEAAFRLAVAKKTGLQLILLDHDSPISEDYMLPLMDALIKAEAQVILTWTTSKRPTQPTPPGRKRYWLSLDANGGTKVEVLP